MTAAMRDALIGRLHASLQGKGVALADVTLAVDAALATTGYEDLAALASSAVVVQDLVADGGGGGAPTPELASAMATLETRRMAVAGHPINGVLVEPL